MLQWRLANAAHQRGRNALEADPDGVMCPSTKRINSCCSGGGPVRQSDAAATRLGQQRVVCAGEALQPSDLGLHNADEARAFAEQVGFVSNDIVSSRSQHLPQVGC